ncbi:MAG: hypothetical protein IE889_01075 [Campylobacterales bacterium]|nr:hypothetical protein [Campylobacterales bacterium]
MSENCFVRQEASLDIIANVTNFCSECYNVIQEHEVIFYDMQNYRYLCETCKQSFQEKLDSNCELIENETEPLF